MKAVWVLTLNSVREMVRDRTVSLVFFAALALVGLSSLLGSLSLDEQRRILIHLGFGAIHWTAIGLVLFQGSFTIQREIERQTCLMVLARPVSRREFLLGKFLGIASLVFCHLVLTGFMLFALLGFEINFGAFVTVLLGIFVEVLLVLAFVFFVSQWVRPVVSVFGGFGLFLVGNWLQEMRFLAEKSKDVGFQMVTSVFQYVFPNLYRLNFRSESFVDQIQVPADLGLLFLHFGVWLLAFLFLATFSFSRRDLV